MRRMLAGIASAGLLATGTAHAQLFSAPGIAVSAITSYATGSWPFNTPNMFVRVTGEGANRDQALDNAFKNAVTKATGVVLSSENEARNDVLTKDDLLSYSSGFVSSFEVVKEQATDTGYKVEIAAKIASNKIANRILGRSTGQADVSSKSQQVYAQASTVLRERSAGDSLLKSLMADYPHNSFVVKARGLNLGIDQNRNTIVTIPLHIKWAPGYLDAFEDTVKYVSLDKCSPFQRCENSVKFSMLKNYALSDNRQYNLVEQVFTNKLFVEMTIKNIHGTTEVGCFPVNLNMVKVNPYDTNIEFDGDDHKVNIVLPVANVGALRQVQQIDTRLVKYCGVTI
jgi:hypothetical protein